MVSKEPDMIPFMETNFPFKKLGTVSSTYCYENFFDFFDGPYKVSSMVSNAPFMAHSIYKTVLEHNHFSRISKNFAYQITNI